MNGELVRQIMQSLLPVLNKKTLILFTGGAADGEALLKVVDQVLATEAKIAFSTAFQRIANDEFLQKIQARTLFHDEAMRAFLTNADLVVVPVLTRNTMIKASLGIQDSLVTNGIAMALMRCIPIVGVRENYHPDSEHTRSKGYAANSRYNKMLLQYEQNLIELGAILVDSAEFSDTMKRTLYPGVFGDSLLSKAESCQTGDVYFGNGTVITCRELQHLPKGTGITISGRVVITPLAQEYITKQHMTLRYE